MKISFSNSKEDWNKFLIENDGSFLQSWEWGEFQNCLSKKIWRFEIKEQEKTLAQAQVIRERFRFGKSCFYIAYGPCFKESLFLKGKKEVLDFILKESKKVAQKENSFFLRIESTSPLPRNIKEAVSSDSSRRVQPRRTLILNLKKPEEEIFNNFHSKTRYDIRLAEKKGIKIRILNLKLGIKSEDWIRFLKLIQVTAKRKKIKPYPRDYYRKLLEVTNANLFLAEYKNKIIAGNIVIFFGRRATYLHGASNYKYRKLMAPHLLQWIQIKEAKKGGYEIYDFWGIDETKWPGLTRFKKSFGGEEIEYSRGKDFIFSNFWYRTYKLLRKIL